MPNNIYLKKFFNWVNGRLSAWCLLNYSPVISHQFIFQSFLKNYYVVFLYRKKNKTLSWLWKMFQSTYINKQFECILQRKMSSVIILLLMIIIIYNKKWWNKIKNGNRVNKNKTMENNSRQNSNNFNNVTEKKCIL